MRFRTSAFYTADDKWLTKSRKRVYRGLRRIHQAGIAQGDFGEHNIVVRKRPDGSYWPTIVDFNNAYEHECIVHGKKTQIYGSPIPERDVCTELFSAGCEGSIDIWKPGECLLHGVIRSPC